MKLANRIVIIAILLFLATEFAADAQTAQTARRIGWLNLGTPEADLASQKVFRDALRELGWTDGVNVVFESAFAEGRAERLPSLVAELLSRNVEIIATAGTTAIRAARNGTSTIPIVMIGGGDPVGSGLVQSLARPGGNITGVSLLGQELVAKNLDLMKQAMPRLRTAVLIRAAANPANRFFLDHFGTAGRKLGITVSPVDIADPAELADRFAGITADAAFILLDAIFHPHRAQIAQLAIQKRLPLSSADRAYAEAGLLFTYGYQYEEIVRSAAPFVDKILRGAKPGDLPIEQPKKLDLAINLKTAKAIGVTIPRPLLLQADLIIQ